ncbi:cysteine-rich receptor-like protein kinase 2 [Cryptomeria japonica]|uniref:cysteine-rich receptor-like protein kinase 2 n=1 Tax=Cryptomeria japonica TaxID=3369 RepID=UPI0027DA4AD2|nr:cysteine-rich receptor-like protein kinase 2 [Cryptomeria japonica]
MAGRRWQVENTVRFTILFHILIMAPIRADPETRLLSYLCSNGPPNNATVFQQILNSALASVMNEAASSGFATKDEETSSDTTTDSVYVLAQCRKDKSSADCISCIKVAENQIHNCSGVSATAYYDGCYLRYENFNFYDLRYYRYNSYDLYNHVTPQELCGNVDAANSDLISATGGSLISDLCTATPRLKYYFAAGTRQGPSNTTIYGLAFCLRSLQEDSCKSCLNIAQRNINKCFPHSEGRAIDAGCYLRYSSEPFFPSNATVDLAPFLPTGKSASSPRSIILCVVGGVFLLGLLTCLLVFRKQIMRPSQKKADIEGATDLRGPEDFEFKILKKATNNFDQANKLGQGGFGEVFKGTLKNGKVVAVKKLTLGHSTRAISEFESEVRLISNVHHRNLVRLLGCCRQGQERLLIYEYMPNSSLDRILFGKKRRLLSWKERFNIILGTGRGLAYLHEEFHVCILHRDIKSSNILLDHNFQAEIADFELARLLPNDKSHVSTRVAGTLGYTAPEYASHGQLTEKADTYSFGVVVLEIVLEVVENEKEMEGYNEEEVLRVINLALLCIQDSARRRPSMSEVVTTLLNKDEIDFQKCLHTSFVDMTFNEFTESNTAVTKSLSSR